MIVKESLTSIIKDIHGILIDTLEDTKELKRLDLYRENNRVNIISHFPGEIKIESSLPWSVKFRELMTNRLRNYRISNFNNEFFEWEWTENFLLINTI